MPMTLLIVTAIMATSIFLIVLSQQAAQYYRENYHFSIWSGAFIVVIALTSFGSFIRYRADYFSLVICTSLLILTLIQDIRLSDLAHGLIAFLYQIMIALLFAIIISMALAMLIICIFVRHISKVSFLFLKLSIAEFIYGWTLFPLFFR